MNQPGGRQPVVVQPLASRLEIHASPDQLKLEFQSRSRWYHRLLAAIPVVWCGLGAAVFLVAAVAVMVVLVTGAVPVNASPLAIGLCFPPLLLGIVAWPVLIWWVCWRQFTAVLIWRETITVNATEWMVERDLGLWRSRQRFAAEAISRVRLVPARSARPFQVWTTLLNEPGAVALHVGRRRVGLAYTATEEEARRLVAAFGQRFPDKVEPAAAPPDPGPVGREPWQVDRQAGGLVVTLPVRPSWRRRLELVWNVLFSFGWVIGIGALAVQGLASSPAPLSFAILMVVIVGAGLVGGLWSLREAWWALAGREVMAVTALGMTLDAANLWLSRPRVFAAPHIRHLRVVVGAGRAQVQTVGMFRQPGQFGALAFDYGAATYRCGATLTPAEAAALRRLILEHFPDDGRAA